MIEIAKAGNCTGLAKLSTFNSELSTFKEDICRHGANFLRLHRVSSFRIQVSGWAGSTVEPGLIDYRAYSESQVPDLKPREVPALVRHPVLRNEANRRPVPVQPWSLSNLKRES
jgi:hypothetical protein